MGGGNLAAFDHAAVLLLFGLLAVFVVHFRRLARAAFVLPVIPLFISSRSLAEYFMTLAAVMVLSVASVEPASLVIRARRRPLAADVRALLTAACLAPALICLILALVARPPLTLRVVSFRTTGQLQSIWHLQVAVDNHSGSALTPRFAANSIGQATTFWSITRGPRTLAPGASATYALTAPNIGSMPAISSSLTLEAFTQQPATFSSTGLITPEPYLAVIDPGLRRRAPASRPRDDDRRAAAVPARRPHPHRRRARRPRSDRLRPGWTELRRGADQRVAPGPDPRLRGDRRERAGAVFR